VAQNYCKPIIPTFKVVSQVLGAFEPGRQRSAHLARAALPTTTLGVIATPTY
jgi:hypothetical protein